MTSLWKVYFSLSFLPAHPSPQSRTLVGLFELAQLPSRDFNLASCVVSETTDMIVKSQQRRFELLTRPDMEHSSELWRVSSRAQEPLRAIPWSGPTTKSLLTSINMQIEKNHKYSQHFQRQTFCICHQQEQEKIRLVQHFSSF